MKKKCIIGAVGKNSQHKNWMSNEASYDLHLIVYDDSLDKYHHDTQYICHMKGMKLNIVSKYLERNPWIISQYDYFFIPDDDVLITTSEIEELFNYMEQFNLKIAQPSLSNSYYSWAITLRNKFTELRYTNFVEMMAPCFSKEALKSILFSFTENESGWGTEFHWHSLIGGGTTDMAILDNIYAMHTKPVQQDRYKNEMELQEYIKKYSLDTNIKVFGKIDRTEAKICDKPTYERFRNILVHWAEEERIKSTSVGLNGYCGYIYLFYMLCEITESRNYADRGKDIFLVVSKYFSSLRNNMDFYTGLPGVYWLLSYLSRNKTFFYDITSFIKEVYMLIEQRTISNWNTLTISEKLGFAACLFSRNLGVGQTFSIKEEIFLKEVLREAQSKLDTLDIMALIVVLQILYKQNKDVKQLQEKIEREIYHYKGSALQKTYWRYKLFEITKSPHLSALVENGLRNINDSMLCTEDAIMMAEMISD